MFAPSDYFDLNKTPFPELYQGLKYVWEAIPRIAGIIETNLEPGVHDEAGVSPGAFVGERVQIGPGTVLEHGAVVLGPAIIGAGCRIRVGAYLRENVIVGDGTVAGNSCEFKNCVLHNAANVPHFAYVGDSLLGHKAHLGAGVAAPAGRRRVGTHEGKARAGVLLDDARWAPVRIPVAVDAVGP